MRAGVMEFNELIRRIGQLNILSRRRYQLLARLTTLRVSLGLKMSKPRFDVIAPDNQRGLTLVETLVAVLLIAFVAFAHGRLNVSIIETNRHGANLTAASNLALDQVEFLQQQDYASVTSGSDGPLKADGTSGGMYSRAWVVTNDTPVTGAKTVVVTVSWTDTASARSVAFSTIVTE